jgi:hypothetical protein
LTRRLVSWDEAGQGYQCGLISGHISSLPHCLCTTCGQCAMCAIGLAVLPGCDRGPERIEGGIYRWYA